MTPDLDTHIWYADSSWNYIRQVRRSRL